MDHAYETGLAKCGEESVHATINEHDAYRIAKMALKGRTNNYIHIKTGISAGVIRDIRKGQSWKRTFNKTRNYLSFAFG